jgi:hypothetical protein
MPGTNIKRAKAIILPALIISFLFLILFCVGPGSVFASILFQNQTLVSIEPAAPVLLRPSANANIFTSPITFEWMKSSGAKSYKLEIRYNDDDETIFKTYELGDASAKIVDGFANDGTQYKWRVQAGDGTKWIDTAWSEYRIFNNGIIPAPPILASPANNAIIAGSSFFFRWLPSNEATKYEIKVSKSGSDEIFDMKIVGHSSHIVLNHFMNDGTEYEWCVRAGNSFGWSDWSGRRTFTNGVKIAAPVLYAPADNANFHRTTVVFDWKPVDGATKYQLRIVNSELLGDEELDGDISEDKAHRTVTLGNSRSSMQHGLLENTHYWWQVRGGNDSSDYEWGEWSLPRSLIIGNLLSSPALISPAEAVYKDTVTVGDDLDGGIINFQWAASPGATKYEFEIIRVRDGAVFGNQVIGNVTNYNQPGFTEDSEEYKWRVRAGKTIGSGKNAAIGWGHWTVYRHFVYDRHEASLASPVLKYPDKDTYVSSRSIEFQWSTVSGAKDYQIQVVRVRDGYVEISGPVGNVNSSTQTGFPNDGSAFMWRLRAADDNGKWGPWSLYTKFTNGFDWRDPYTQYLPF